MKKILIVLISIISVAGFAQKKEKIKGNKEVLIKKFTVPSFSAIEVGEKFKVAIQKTSDTTRVVIEADDNLFDVIHYTVTDNVLSFSTSKEIVKKKRLRITVFVPEKFNAISVKEKGQVFNEEDVVFDNMKITATQRGEIDLNLQIKNNLVVDATDKTELVINGRAKTAKIHISESAEVKGEFSTDIIDLDLDDHAYCNFEGSANQLKLEAKSKSELKFRSFKTINAKLSIYDKSDVIVHVSDNLVLNASGSSSTEIYGTPKINLNSFKDNATLYKKK
jgi:hypothetical protein